MQRCDFKDFFFLKRKEKNPLNDHENLNCQAGFGVKQGEI